MGRKLKRRKNQFRVTGAVVSEIAELGVWGGSV